MATLAFCIASNRRDLENARIVSINTNPKTKVAEIVPPCDNDLKPFEEPVSLGSKEEGNECCWLA